MEFHHFIGNEKLKEQLRYMMATGHFPHAVLLEGETGIGKRTLAHDIALNLFCRGEGEKPCGHCAQCSKVEKGIHPDIYEYTAPDRVKAFHIDRVREVKRDAFMRPNEADWRIFILGNCQSMSAEAQNALLKILEEPPTYALFLLTATNKSAMLETVLSRCVVLSLEGVPAAQGADYVCAQMPSVSHEEALHACEVWGGNLGKAMESLSDGRLSKVNQLANGMAEALLSGSEYRLLKTCSEFRWDRELLAQTLTLFKTVLRDALVYGSSEPLSGNAAMAEQLAATYSRAKLMRMVEAMDRLQQLTLVNANMQLMMTRVCTELMNARG